MLSLIIIPIVPGDTESADPNGRSFRVEAALFVRVQGNDCLAPYLQLYKVKNTLEYMI